MGKYDDRVRLEFGDSTDSTLFNQYEVSQSYFTIPSAFSVRFGSGESARTLMRKYPPGTRYRLFIGDVLQHSGAVDGYTPEGGAGATELNLRGRDDLAPYVDMYADADRAFSEITFKDLTYECLKLCGIAGFSLNSDNAANRKAVSNDYKSREVERDVWFIEVQKELAAGKTVIEQVVKDKKFEVTNRRALTLKCGDRVQDFLKKEHDRTGLFLIAAADEKNFILGTPQGKQSPVTQIIRQRGGATNAVNVLRASHNNDMTGRHAKYTVVGRGGTGKDGRQKVVGSVEDAEVAAAGFTKRWTKVDSEAKSSAQAEHLARKKCAEARRAGWSLTYTMRGHTSPIVDAPERRYIWTPDTVVHVRDDEYGIDRDMWVESVNFRGSVNGGTTTEVKLVPPETLVFAFRDVLPIAKKGTK